MNESAQTPEPEEVPKIELSTSSMFPGWLAGQRTSIVLTTYQTAKLFLIGLQPNGRLSIFERTLHAVFALDQTFSPAPLSLFCLSISIQEGSA